jgi:hypothetical protein
MFFGTTDQKVIGLNPIEVTTSDVKLHQRPAKVLILLVFFLLGISKMHKNNQNSGEQSGEQKRQTSFVHQHLWYYRLGLCFRKKIR